MDNRVDLYDCYNLRRLRVSQCVQPLTWSFGHIISEYSNDLSEEHFSEESREAIVEDSLIALRLAQGMVQCGQDSEKAMANILLDERQCLGRRALDRFVGAGYKNAEGR